MLLILNTHIQLYSRMNTNETMSEIEINKAIIQRYFEAYNNRMKRYSMT
jgi:hypothetical protein